MVWRRPNFVSVVAFFGNFTLSKRFYFIVNLCCVYFISEFRKNASPEETLQAMIDDSIAYFILSLISTAWQFVFGIFCVDCFNRTAIRQVTRIRTKYFESLMRQDIGWYDIAAGRTNFSIRITEYVTSPIQKTIITIITSITKPIRSFFLSLSRDIEKIKTGLAEDVSHFLNLMFSFVICVVISFIYGWKLTLIVISYLPLVFATNIIIGKVSSNFSLLFVLSINHFFLR